MHISYINSTKFEDDEISTKNIWTNDLQSGNKRYRT